MLSHYYGREAGLELREDNETVLTKDMVVSMEPCFTIPQGMDGAGGYREHDILIVTEDGADNITKVYMTICIFLSHAEFVLFVFSNRSLTVLWFFYSFHLDRNTT